MGLVQVDRAKAAVVMAVGLVPRVALAAVDSVAAEIAAVRRSTTRLRLC